MDSDLADMANDYNTAVAAIFRARRGELSILNNAIGESAGMHPVTVVRLLKNQRAMTMGQFIGLSAALDLDPAEVIAEAERRVSNSNGKSAL